jgi:transcriptional regulator with GAF, ATPase, and Fis domain
MKTELNYLRGEVGRKYHFDNIIGRSIAIKQVYALMEKAIDSGLTVLISGETGTGKELVAKAIHYQSPRKDRPLQELNCGAIPKDLVASTLFGHRKGAFTGANEDKMGLFEVASGGTVLLDEIGEMPEDAQVHLLRVLQERKVQRIGETQLRDVDVRVIAITNRDLMAEVEAEHFREDLYYRVSVFPIHVPPLRERVDDIPLLAEHFLREACRQQNRKLDGFAPHVMEMLQSYPWPGNVRELEHEIARAVALMEEGPDSRDAESRDLRIQTYHFSSRLTGGESLIQEILSARIGLSEAVERLQRRLIENALQECGGNRSQAARMLGIHQPNLVRLMKRLSIE